MSLTYFARSETFVYVFLKARFRSISCGGNFHTFFLGLLPTELQSKLAFCSQFLFCFYSQCCIWLGETKNRTPRETISVSIGCSVSYVVLSVALKRARHWERRQRRR
uniref:Uncharacterized protein n=1 Tax=Rhipicephalus zambeziensis TaxID=60191 RepID=A0A224YET5_9ACAR